jgi:hypothetical protein
LITGFESIIPSLSLPDENDRHVFAAAICGRADVIVTTNVRDFPDLSLANLGICPIRRDDEALLGPVDHDGAVSHFS